MIMKSNFVKALQFVFFLLTGLVLLYFAFRGINVDEVVHQIRQVDYRWVAFSLLFGMLALLFRTIRWRLLIEPLDKRPRATNIFHAINIGYFANFLFPRIGEVIRCGILNRTDRVPVDKLFGTVVVERVFDMFMTFFILCLIMLLRFTVVGSFIMEHIIRPVIDRINGIVSIAMVIVLSVLVIFVLYRIFKKKLYNITAKLKDLLHGIVEGVKSVRQLRRFKLFILLNFFVFGMYFLQTYVLFFAFECASSLGLGDALFVLALSGLAVIVPVQGGIGAYHWIVSMGLTIPSLGLTREEGMAYATLSHSVTSILFIMLGTISLILVLSRKMAASSEH